MSTKPHKEHPDPGGGFNPIKTTTGLHIEQDFSTSTDTLGWRGAVLCIIGFLAAAPASAFQMPVAPTHPPL